MNRKAFKILIIDDDLNGAELVKSVLKRSVFPVDVQILEDGAQAMQSLRETGSNDPAAYPDMILLDLNMPGKDGYAILREIRRSDDLKQIPVIILSGSSEERDVAKAYREGANSFIAKPMGLVGIENMAKAIDVFWFQTAKLPHDAKEAAKRGVEITSQ